MKKSISQRIASSVGVLFAICAFQSPLNGADENRLYIPAKVDQKPVRLMFDTGWTGKSVVLFEDAVKKLNLKIVPTENTSLVNGSAPLGLTAKYNFSFLGHEDMIDFYILKVPDMIKSDGDGVLPYPTVAHLVWAFDLSHGLFSAVVESPTNLHDFISAKIVQDPSKILTLEVPAGGKTLAVAVDPGKDSGLSLPREEFEAWLAKHPKSRLTVDAGYTAGIGLDWIGGKAPRLGRRVQNRRSHLA
jgi:hypothetical protein